jgi:hypothetical protein
MHLGAGHEDSWYHLINNTQQYNQCHGFAPSFSEIEVGVVATGGVINESFTYQSGLVLVTQCPPQH